MIDSHFIYNHDFRTKVNQMIILRESMNDAKEKLTALGGHFSTDEWMGEGKEEACAYTTLIIMYMNQLCGSSITPCEKMEETLKAFMNNMDHFEEDSVAAADLKSIAGES